LSTRALNERYKQIFQKLPSERFLKKVRKIPTYALFVDDVSILQFTSLIKLNSLHVNKNDLGQIRLVGKIGQTQLFWAKKND